MTLTIQKMEKRFKRVQYNAEKKVFEKHHFRRYGGHWISQYYDNNRLYCVDSDGTSFGNVKVLPDYILAICKEANDAGNNAVRKLK